MAAKGFYMMEDVFSWAHVLEDSPVQILAPLKL
jgi:hypothetical protein